MIHFLTGKPGAGKGVIATLEIIKELVNGDRVIVVDLSVKLLPWVRDMSKGGFWAKTFKRVLRPERGLLAYMVEKYGQTYWAEKRIKIITEAEAGEFYLHRMCRKSGEWIVLDAERDEKGRIVSFDTSREVYPTLYVSDECWRTFGARDWQNTSKGIVFYAAQHRKLGDEWFLTAQNTKQIETALRQLAQDFWVVRNHGKMRLGPFRQPSVMSINIYDQAPTNGNAVVVTERQFVKLDKEGIGSCFDTSGGTGVSGGRSADLMERKRGLPFIAMAIVIVLLLIGLSKAPALVAWFAKGAVKVATNKVPSVVPVAVNTNTFAQNIKAAAAGFVGAPASSNHVEHKIPDSEVVKYCGKVWDGNVTRALLSNGRMFVIKQGIGQLPDGQWWVDGIIYPEAKVASEPYVPPVFPVPEGSIPEPARPEAGVSVYLFGKREEQHAKVNPYRNNNETRSSNY